jgi:hypothetical protein
MIQNQLKAHFLYDKLKSYEWNPAEYNVCGAFAEILNGKYDSLEVRLHSFNKKWRQFQPIMKQQQILKSNIRAYCSWDLSKFRWSVRFSKRFDYCFK